MNNETKLLQGSMNGAGLKIGIVCARFNSIFVEQLLSGAEDSLVRHGVDAKDITVAWVPGSFETPLVLQRMAATGKFDALIGLGVVIQGATQHAQMINSEVSKAYAQISLNFNLPVVYGVVTTENIEQAIERSGSKAGNRGASAAATAIEMANLLRQLPAKAHK
ncbi:MAG: 6,7-dimethyl-8-ribityllumazine synthase [Victivallales bacterium]|jgi:6,7-dimethyl-8-ribityllumazine synthase|nr:6,7-dimethyl-8-ribityllumazine synthase [Victivallales bacterium]